MASARISVAAVALTLLGASGVGAQDSFSIADVAVLTGCWTGEFAGLTLSEQWSETEGGVMLGTTRFFREGRVVDFEFGRFVETEDGVTLWPYPQGTISEHGFPLVRAGRELVFENLEHDFPVRIIYERISDDELRPRIEGRDGRGRGWHLERVSCPG